MHMELSQEEFCGDIYRKMPHASPTDIVLCELAQSKCTWTCHKRHFVRKFRGKMPDANPGASILWTCHKRHFVRKFTRKTPDASNTTSIEHRASTVTVRTLQCGHTVWEIVPKKMMFNRHCPHQNGRLEVYPNFSVTPPYIPLISINIMISP